jgi:hypothetical protein
MFNGIRKATAKVKQLLLTIVQQEFRVPYGCVMAKNGTHIEL